MVLNRQLRQADAGSVLHTSASNNTADAGRTQVSSWIQTGCTRRQNVLTLADGEREREKKGGGGSSQGGSEPRTSPPTHLCLSYLALSLLPFRRPLLDLIYSRDASLIHICCFWLGVFFFVFFLNWRRKFRVSLNTNKKIHRHQNRVCNHKKKKSKKMFHSSLQKVDPTVFVLGFRVPAVFRPRGRNRPPSCASKSVEQVAKSVLRLCCRTEQQRQHQIITYVRICPSSLSWRFARITFFLFYVGFRQPQISASSITINDLEFMMRLC